MTSNTFTALFFTTVALIVVYIYTRPPRPAKRTKIIPPDRERVLILGASSGVGSALAKYYARRKARICIVARRREKLEALAEECYQLAGGSDSNSASSHCFSWSADISHVAEMCALRRRVTKEWGGIDTMYVCAGVSALQPLMALAGIGIGETRNAEARNIEQAVGIAGKAIKGNFEGPLVAALTFVPLLECTSERPAILLLNSLASVVAAPTRSLYAASKASSLLLYQALAIEHPKIAFTFLLPSTIEGDFRASAVDGGPVREADPNKTGLKRDYVAERCFDAVDRGVRNNIILPWWPNALGPHLYAFWPAFIQEKARKKYNFEIPEDTCTLSDIIDEN